MRFAEPSLLYLLLLLPLLVLLGLLLARRGSRRLRAFAGDTLHLSRIRADVSVHRRAAKAILLLVAVTAGIVAAARPQWGTRMETVRRQGLDIVVALDTSLSMAADDVAPSRFDAARHAARSLLGRLEGNRVALVTFAGRATLSCPLTLDHEAARLFLEAMDLRSPSVQGTSLAEGLRRAFAAFGERDGTEEQGSRALVLFSDGENHEEGVEQELARFKQAGIPIYTVGIGTGSGGPIPLSGDGNGGYKKDREGKVVTTRLDERSLEDLAVETSGRYYRATPAELEIDEIVEAISGQEARELGSVLRTRYEERFHYPLVVALLALVAETLLTDRRMTRRAKEGTP